MQKNSRAPGALSPQAWYVVKTGLRAAILLLFCQCLLLWFGGPPTYETYYIGQNASAMGDTASNCVILSFAGAAFVQYAARGKR